MPRTEQPHKLAFETFVAKVTDFDNPVNGKHRNLSYTKPETRAAWNGSKQKIPIWCETHEEFFVQVPANHMFGQGCPKCGVALRTAKKTKKDPIADFRRVHGDTYDYSRVEYVNTHVPVEIVCKKHGAFRQKPGAHLTGHGCPQCWEDRRRAFGAERNEAYQATYAERAARVHDGAYAIVKMPTAAHDTVRLMCPTHGEFEQKAFSHLDGHGCPACGRTVNYAQLEVASFVEGLGVRIEHEDKEILDGLHIDIWAPDHRVGIEYHGCYWHTEDRIGNKHREKYDRAQSADVRLIQIFDFEWIEKREAVESRLRAAFGCAEVANARACEVCVLDRPEAKAFLKQHHTQGSGVTPQAAYGLKLNGRLLACITLGPNRYGKAGWEVLRYASVGRVRGGFSRLFARFLKDHQPAEVTSYCDLRWGDGKMYEAAGFALEAVTRPDYFYVDRRGQKVSRYLVQSRPKGVSERKWVEDQGLKKVLGVGHQRWVWRQ